MMQDKLQFTIDQEVMFSVDRDTKGEHFIFISCPAKSDVPKKYLLILDLRKDNVWSRNQESEPKG